MSIIVEVHFEVVLDPESMPNTYSDPDYLEEIIDEAIHDAMYDIGAGKVSFVRMDIEGLE